MADAKPAHRNVSPGTSHGFSLGPFHYPSKAALKKALKDFLGTAADGPITPPVRHHALLHLISRHPDAERKIGVGVHHFEVLSNTRGSGRSFVVVRLDETSVRFAYDKCIDRKMEAPEQRAKEAFRFAVRDQLWKYRSSIKLPIRCALTKRWIFKPEDMEIDHKVPFWMLLNRFLKEERLSISNVATIGNGEDLSLADPALKLRWQRFHAANAELQPLFKLENRAKGGALF